MMAVTVRRVNKTKGSFWGRTNHITKQFVLIHVISLSAFALVVMVARMAGEQNNEGRHDNSHT